MSNHDYDVSSVSFFFSSRRRHTRSKRDWSSDVCSSDLLSSKRPASSPRDKGKGRKIFHKLRYRIDLTTQPAPPVRSEERRVGKSVGLGGGRGVKKKRSEADEEKTRVVK